MKQKSFQKEFFQGSLKKGQHESYKKRKTWLYAGTVLTLFMGPTLVNTAAHADTTDPSPAASAAATSSLSETPTVLSTEASSEAATNVAPTSFTSPTAASSSSATTSTAASNPSSSATLISFTSDDLVASTASDTSASSEMPSLASVANSMVSSAVATDGTLGTDPSSLSLDSPLTSTTSANSTVSGASLSPNTATLVTTTTHQFYVIAKDSFLVGEKFDAAHSTTSNTLVPIKTGDLLYENSDGTGQAYEVLSSVDSDDSASGYPDNGMQAYAVAPLVNGSVDTSRIVISYAGSNFDNEPNDWLTDIETVVGGSDTLVPLDGGPILPSQAVTAEEFARALMAQYPTASFTFTGISLGGYLAMAVGAVTHQPVVAFVGPNPSNILTQDEIAYVQAHPNLYFDIRNTWDTILGAYGGNALNTAIYYNFGEINPISSHTPVYNFNVDGSLNEPASPVLGPLINDFVTAPDSIISPLVSGVTLGLIFMDIAVDPLAIPFVSTVGAAVSADLNALSTTATTFINAASTVSATIFDAFGKLF